MYECSDSASGSVCLGLPDPHPNPLVHRYESEDPDPRLDPYQNVTDPQHTISKSKRLLLLSSSTVEFCVEVLKCHILICISFVYLTKQCRS